MHFAQLLGNSFNNIAVQMVVVLPHLTEQHRDDRVSVSCRDRQSPRRLASFDHGQEELMPLINDGHRFIVHRSMTFQLHLGHEASQNPEHQHLLRHRQHEGHLITPVRPSPLLDLCDLKSDCVFVSHWRGGFAHAQRCFSSEHSNTLAEFLDLAYV